MPPFDDSGLRAHLNQFTRGVSGVIESLDFHSEQNLGFWHVGRDNKGKGYQKCPKRVYCLFLKQPITSLAIITGSTTSFIMP